ncbi:hypothetical protein Pan44_14430 [Caulifigura coniformis]|uniref:Uncharacterized protein n=1 Tax=Caulifigura coniformis TaxID=2527983 RepID=A0A517SBF9_9PLAN|nr:hypothetical protein [Caulifigura coniformis]QDT53426.1 hypothetical protein Pan44_14430 [Caulifigura coniformis]
MSKSQLTCRAVFCGAVGFVTIVGLAWADQPAKSPFAVPDPNTPPLADAPQGSATPQSGDLRPGGSKSPEPTPVSEPAKASRITFESNWKNVEVGAKPMYFRQGDKAFVWTVKNVGENPVEIGDDYGFSIAPGAEEFIVDTRLTLSAAEGKSTKVEVNASRVMTRSELTDSPQPTPGNGPTYAPPRGSFAPSASFRAAPSIDPFGPSPAPAEPAATAIPKRGQKQSSTVLDN